MLKTCVVFLVSVLLSACNTTDPPPQGEPVMKIEAIDASCTEAWLELRLVAGIQPRTISVQRDTQTILTTNLAGTDTVIVDEGLLPNRQYTYTLTRSNGILSERTTATITTMDTTSHNFTWQIDTLGDASSVLRDIAIINDTLAYAVGELYLRDSTGQIDPRRYNIAIWNGTLWRIERLLYQGSPPVLRSIFAFGENDVWLDPWFHWNGQTFQQVPIDPIFIGVGVNKMWGSPDGRLYVVGNAGFIAERGSTGTWQRIESGTNLDMRDIWGASNQSGQMEILALASTYTAKTQESMILKIDDNTATPVNINGLARDMASIWFTSERKYYAVGAGVHHKRSLSDSAWRVYAPGEVTRFGSDRVRGKNINDVFVVGSFGEVVHFNGVTWHRYFSQVPLPSGAYGSVAVTDRLVIAVGDIGASRAIVLIGRR